MKTETTEYLVRVEGADVLTHLPEGSRDGWFKMAKEVYPQARLIKITQTTVTTEQDVTP